MIEAFRRKRPASLRVSTDVGAMRVHKHDKVMTPWILKKGTWEEEEACFMRKNVENGFKVLDVGANVGYFSLLLADLVGDLGSVVAIEPERENAFLLRLNIRENGHANRVEVREEGASSRNETLAVLASDENRGDQRLFKRETLSAGIRVTHREIGIVRCRAVDSWWEGPLDFAKIDTQGLDHEVVDGMRETIGANPQIQILTEFWLDGLAERDVDPRQVLRFYRSLGLDVSLLDKDGEARKASDSEVIMACESWGGRFVNLVLG